MHASLVRTVAEIDVVIDAVPDALSDDDVFDAISDRRRRRVLRRLPRHGGSIDVSELAAGVVAEETDASPDAIPYDDRQRAVVSLVHCHLPKLADVGLVEYDADRETVALADAAGELVRELDRSDSA